MFITYLQVGRTALETGAMPANNPLHLPAGVRLGEAYGLPLARRR